MSKLKQRNPPRPPKKPPRGRAEESPVPSGAAPAAYPDWRRIGDLSVFGLTIFLSAFLLFQVQPVIGKYILPWFGGGPGVWTTCMLFFQALLLVGYAYAHFTSRWLKLRSQIILQVLLFGAAVALLPIIPRDSWKPTPDGKPVAQILLLLAANLGLPYFVLSAMSPLLQRWFSRARPGASPYRLFALSNFGSLLALVSYPFFFETHLTRKAQAALWAYGLVACAACCAVCAVKAWKAARDETLKPESTNEPAVESGNAGAFGPSPSSLHRVLWLLLPACASVQLLATTNKLCLDMPVIPLLWVLPLGLYLLSFVICFDHARWYRRFPAALALVAALGAVCWAIRQHDLPVWHLVAVYSAALFVGCMVCHGELYRLRPDPRWLTGFYLTIALGGALGGTFVAVVAPVIFRGYHELYLGALLCPMLFLVACVLDRSPTEAGQWRWISGALPIIAVIGLDRLLAEQQLPTDAGTSGWFNWLRIVMWAAVILVFIRAMLWRQNGKSAAGVLGILILFPVLAPWADRKKFAEPRHVHRLAVGWMTFGVLVLGAALWLRQEKFGDKLMFASRNFYGVVRVFDHSQGEPPEHIIWVSHGNTLHGAQFADPAKASWPTIYYSEQSGIGLALRALPAGGRRIGLVGLGAGTLATYARPQDYVHIYEINPAMVQLAESSFTYLSNCAARLELTSGDARLSLEREPPQDFDLLALDAFSSDAVPVHLLTTEAFEVYDRHLKTNGVIAVHISNKWLDLEPVLANVAAHFNFNLEIIDHTPDGEQWWLRRSQWALLTRNPEIINSPDIRATGRPADADAARVPLWTDDFSSLFQILR